MSGAPDGFDFDPQALFDEAHDAFAAEHGGDAGVGASSSSNPFNFTGQPPPSSSNAPAWSVAPQPDALSMLRGGIRQSSAPRGGGSGMLSASSPIGEIGEHGDDFEEHEYEQADDHAMVILQQQQQQTPEGPLPQTGGGQPASGPTSAGPTSASIPTNDAQFFDQSLRPWEKTGYHLLDHDEACASELRWDAPNPEQREFHGLAANFVERWQHFAGDEEVFDSESDQHFAALRSLVRSFAAVCQKRVRELQLMESRDGVERTSLQWLRVERNTWWLMDTLLAIWSEPREATPPGGYPLFSFNQQQQSELPADLHYGDEFLAVHKLTCFADVEANGDSFGEGADSLLQSAKSDESRRAATLYQSMTRIVTWFENCALQEIEHHDLVEMDLDAMGGRPRGGRGRHRSAVDPDAADREGVMPPPSEQFRQEALLRQVWELIRAGRLRLACDLCRRMGEHWRAASLQGAQVSGLHLVDGTPATDAGKNESWAWVGNPSRFLWKQIAWGISETAGKSRDVRGTAAQASALASSSTALPEYGGNTTGGAEQHSSATPAHASASQYERAMYAKLCGNMQALLASTHVCPSWEDRCWAMFSCMCERLRDDALMELRATKQAASDPIDGDYLRSRSIASAGVGGSVGGSGGFGSGVAADGWLDHQPGPPDAAAAAEILRRTERANAINRSERPSEEVFSEVGSMEGGVGAGTTEPGTIAHRQLQSNLIMGSLRHAIQAVCADKAVAKPTSSGGGVDLHTLDENGAAIVDPMVATEAAAAAPTVTEDVVLHGATASSSSSPVSEARKQRVDHELLRVSAHLLICYDFLGKFEGTGFAPASKNSVPTGHDHDRVLASYVKFLVSRRQYSLVALYCASMHSAQSRREQYGAMMSKIIDNGRRFMCSTLAVRHFGAGGGLDAVAYAAEQIWTRDEGSDPLTPSEDAALSRVMADLRVQHRLPVADFAKVWGISLLLDVPKNVSPARLGAGGGGGMGDAAAGVPLFETTTHDWLAEAVKQTNALVRHLLLRSALTAERLTLASAVGRDGDERNLLSQQATLTVTGDALPAVYFLLLGLPMVESQGFAAVPAMMNEDVVRELEHADGVDRLGEEDVWEYKCLANYARAHRRIAEWWRVFSTVMATTDNLSGGGSGDQSYSRNIGGSEGTGGAGVVRSAARGIDSRRELKVLKEHCVALQSSADAASLAIEELLVDSFGKEWADHEMRMYEEAGGESQMEHQQQEHFMQMLIESPETNERTQQLALLWRVIVPEMSRLLVRIHADSGRWYTQVGQTSSAVRSLSRAMQVADIVASAEMGNLSDAFSKGHLQVFLEDIRRAGVDLLRVSGKDAVEIGEHE